MMGAMTKNELMTLRRGLEKARRDSTDNLIRWNTLSDAIDMIDDMYELPRDAADRKLYAIAAAG